MRWEKEGFREGRHYIQLSTLQTPFASLKYVLEIFQILLTLPMHYEHSPISSEDSQTACVASRELLFLPKAGQDSQAFREVATQPAS